MINLWDKLSLTSQYEIERCFLDFFTSRGYASASDELIDELVLKQSELDTERIITGMVNKAYNVMEDIEMNNECGEIIKFDASEEDVEELKSIVKTSPKKERLVDANTSSIKRFLEELFDEIGIVNKISIKLPKSSTSQVLNVLNSSGLIKDTNLDVNVSTLGDETFLRIKNR